MRAGLILMMDRTFTHEQNAIIVEKAIRYSHRGVVGVDIAGPRPDGGRYPYRDLAPLVEEARAGGLGVTIHVGEEGGQHGIAEIGEVVEHLRPERIGHGILAAQDEETMRALREAGIVLELCPSSNLLTGALADEDALRDTVPDVRRPRRRVHDRDGRPRDDADAPPGRARAAPPHRRADPGRGGGRQRSRGHSAAFVRPRPRLVSAHD